MWDELGIEPTSDAKAIRRAYAARLRVIDPDRDPAAFQTLRAAYERALFQGAMQARRAAQAAQAQQAQVRTPPPEPRAEDEPPKSEPPAPQPVVEPPAPKPLPPAPTAAPPPSPEEVERQELVRAINAALQRGDTLAALDDFDRAQARGLVRLGERDVALQGIMRAVVGDRMLSAETYLAVVKRVGWDALPTAYEAASEVRRAATARAEAEAWYADLAGWADRADPLRMTFKDPLAGVAVWIRRRRERATSQLLLHGRWFLLSTATVAALKAKLQLYQHYKGWVGQRFQDRDIARAQSLLRHEKAWRNLRTVLFWTAWFLFALVTIMIGFDNQAAFWIFWAVVMLARAITRRLRVALASAKI
jgi:hypothetical protein